MTPDQIKAICNELADRFGHKRMADAAGVVASTWSEYCSYDKPGTTISLGRMFELQRKLNIRVFTDAIIEHDQAGAAEAADPRLSFAQIMQTLGEACMRLQLALADESISPNEKHQLAEDAAALSARVSAFSTSIDALPTGPVRLRAV